ncbi:MAG TPA: GH1 family beta-glucosidase [Bacteroidia bacterium]|nr:GH1 family beta-glucosidase [Bacteroidia bacterium]
MKASEFGSSFKWGVSASAYQTEGAYAADGKGLSIWDVFTEKKRHIRNGANANVSCDFYNRYNSDLDHIQSLRIPNFRFSLSWSRLLPDGIGRVNKKGVDFYNRLIDGCNERGITPWITLYHWDLPQKLSEKGGWINRDVVEWFSEYTGKALQLFGDRVTYWMVLNEPMVFTGAGYFMGIHAPGKKGLGNFLASMHHATLAQAAGCKIIKSAGNGMQAGTTFSCSHLTPYTSSEADQRATVRMDALLNRLFIEPALGLGYPTAELSFLHKAEKYMQPGDADNMKADFDFIGIQNYTRECVAHSMWIPYLNARLIPAHKRKVYHTSMNWEVYPEAIYETLRKFNEYKGIKKLIVTENGAAFHDVLQHNRVTDTERTQYLNDYLNQVLRAKKEGMPVDGYFVWSLTDNFEWAEGYDPRFGLIYVDFATQQRTVKDSGFWYRDFLTRG